MRTDSLSSAEGGFSVEPSGKAPLERRGVLGTPAEDITASAELAASSCAMPNLGSLPVAGETPGRYEGVHEHARGGMGRILVVRDKHLGRDIAMKELLAAGVLDTTDAHGFFCHSLVGIIT